jgi:hypothetical protein
MWSAVADEPNNREKAMGSPNSIEAHRYTKNKIIRTIVFSY